MRRTVVRTQEELDEIEDSKWRRKSYALAQNNALPVPMPLPVYPPPKPCLPPVAAPKIFRPGPRPPPGVYRPAAGYRPSAGHRPSMNFMPSKSEALPTLSEASGSTPELASRRVNNNNNNNKQLKITPEITNIIQLSRESQDQTPIKTPAGSPVTTFLRSSPTSVQDTSPLILTESQAEPDNVAVLPSNPTSSLLELGAPSTTPTKSQTRPAIVSSLPRVPVRPSPPPPTPAGPPTLLSKPSPVTKLAPAETRPPITAKNAPSELSNLPQLETKQPAGHMSRPSPPAKPSRTPTESHPSQTNSSASQVNPQSERVTPKQIQVTSPPEELTSPPEKLMSPPEKVTSQPEKVNQPLGQVNSSLEPLNAPSVQENLPSTKIYSLAKHVNSQPASPLPQQTKPLPELAKLPRKQQAGTKPPSKHTNTPSPPTSNPQPDESEFPYTTDNLPPTPTSERLPPTPTSLSRSPTPTSLGSPRTPSSLGSPRTPPSLGSPRTPPSLGSPRTPPSIRAAPWQPYFPPTPLSRTPRATPTPTSWTRETSPTPSSKTEDTSSGALPATSSSQLFPPTPPSSSYQVGVDSATPYSSMSSLNHVTGETKTMEGDKVKFTPDVVDSSKPSYPAVLDVTSLQSDVSDKVTTFASSPDTHPTNTSTAPQEEAYQTYLSRFWILTVFSFVALLQTTVWGTFGPIAESALAAFPSWTEGTIAAFPNWGPIIVVVFTIPMMWLTQKLGLRLGVLTCALLLTFGTVLRCFTSQESAFTVLCHISSILFAFAACMTLSLPAMIAAIWFAPNERITATAVGTLMCQLGGAAMYMGPLIVESPSGKGNSTIEEREEIRSDIMTLMYIHFGAAALLLLIVVVYFPSQPPSPPSASSAQQRIDFFSGIKGIVKNLQLLLVLLTYAFSFGIPVVWIGVLNLSLIDIDIHQEQAMGVAVTAVACSSIAAFITARITDKVYGHLRVTIIGFLVLASIFFLWFLLLTTQVIVPSLAQVYVAVAGGVAFEYATVPLLVEFAVEIGYPIPESVTGAVLTFSFNLVALVFLGFFQIHSANHIWVSYVLFGCVSLTVLPLIFVKETHKRSETDRKHIQGDI